MTEDRSRGGTRQDAQCAAALREDARRLRLSILAMVHTAGSGHCGGSLSCAELLTVLYRRFLRVRPADPQWADRDRFVLSKGHAAPALYATLAGLGFFPPAKLLTLRQCGSSLQGHPDMRKAAGVEMSTGSLGMGLSNAVGMAWAASRLRRPWRTFVLLGDGELDEGQVWEAAMLASKLDVSSLIAIVDLNGVQLDGSTEEVMPLGDVSARFRAFGWTAATCDGHDVTEIESTLLGLLPRSGPKVLIARTVKGRGVSFMEGDHRWHGARLSDEDYDRAISELAEANA